MATATTQRSQRRQRAAHAKELRAQQARVLLNDEQEVQRAKIALDRAKEKRSRNRDRYKSLIPAGVDVVVAGIRVRRSEKTTGQRFRLGDFLKNHKLTTQMQPFVSEPTTYDAWTVKDLDEQGKA